MTRYFDHIQTQPSVRKAAEALTPAFSVVSLDFNGAPSVERKAPESKKKDKKAADAKKVEVATPSPPPAEASSKPAPKEGEQKAQKKEKKEKKPAQEGGEGKKKGAAGGKGAVPAEDAGEPIPSMIDLRVGHIIDGTSCAYQWSPDAHVTIVKKHPDADGLYVEVYSFMCFFY